jgi:ubiquinone/menaquinone biosynthesis C-methylase UbiE
MLQAKIAASVSATPVDRIGGWNQRMLELEYDADHLDAIQLAMHHVQGLDVACPRILEIGGNASPMIRDFQGELYNVDIDVHGMQMGHLANRQFGGSVKFFVGDANALPFPDEYFDAILMFSSIHHMPDPRASLRHYARKLKPNGLVGVLCEPIGHYYSDNIAPALLSELQNGLNEQTFTLEEWAGIFEDAGLHEREVIVDHGSLKAFLTRNGAKPAD